jgi:hypothetical protein
LQFTSDEGSSSTASRPATERGQSSLERIILSSPVVQFLSPSTRRADEAELQRVEEERAEQELGDSDIVLLEPVATREGNELVTSALERNATDAVVSLSELPLLRKSGMVTGDSAR